MELSPPRTDVQGLELKGEKIKSRELLAEARGWMGFPVTTVKRRACGLGLNTTKGAAQEKAWKGSWKRNQWRRELEVNYHRWEEQGVSRDQSYLQPLDWLSEADCSWIAFGFLWLSDKPNSVLYIFFLTYYFFNWSCIDRQYHVRFRWTLYWLDKIYLILHAQV